MADNLETMGNFSIQDTMEMGMGNQELLNDLFSPETSTSDPNDVTPIIKDAEPAAPAVPGTPKGKDIVPPKSVDGKTDEEKLDGQSMIADFLSDDDEDEDNPAPVVKPTTAPVATPTDDGDEVNEGTQFTALANDLYKLGVFTNDEDEDPETVNGKLSHNPIP